MRDLMTKEEFYEKYGLSDYAVGQMYYALSKDRESETGLDRSRAGELTIKRYFRGTRTKPRVKDLIERVIEAIVILDEPYPHKTTNPNKTNAYIQKIIDIVRKGNVVGVCRRPEKYVSTRMFSRIITRKQEDAKEDPFMHEFYFDNPLDKSVDILNNLNSLSTKEHQEERDYD